MCTLPGGGQLVGAAIIGHDGGLWASSSAFPSASAEEVEAWMKGLADPDSLAMTGIKLGGEMVRGGGGEGTGRGGPLCARKRGAAPARWRALTPSSRPSTSPSAARRAS